MIELTDEINSKERVLFIRRWLGYSVFLGGSITALLSYFELTIIKNDWNVLANLLQPIKYLKDHAPEATVSSITLYFILIITLCLLYIFKFKSLGTKLIGTKKEKFNTILYRGIHISLMTLICLIPLIGMTMLISSHPAQNINANLIYSLLAHLFYCSVIAAIPMSFVAYLTRYPNKIIKKYNIDLWLIKDGK